MNQERLRIEVIFITLLSFLGGISQNRVLSPYSAMGDKSKILDYPEYTNVIESSLAIGDSPIIYLNIIQEHSRYFLLLQFQDSISHKEIDKSDMLCFSTPDPLAETNPHFSPYAFCEGDPINLTDPTGLSTNVMENRDGSYTIVGGDLNDDDLNIYLYRLVENQIERLGSIGITPLVTSFYDSDANNGEGAWAIGAVINPKDRSGLDFINNIRLNTPGNLEYAMNAYGNQKYDFKVSNGLSPSSPYYQRRGDHYRGVMMGNSEGLPIFTSARDLGNIVAGYVMGFNGMPWSLARIGFDALQSLQVGHRATEGISSQNAQKYGYNWGLNQLRIQSTNTLPYVFPFP